VLDCRGACRSAIATAEAPVYAAASAGEIFGATVAGRSFRPVAGGAATEVAGERAEDLQIACHNVAKAPRTRKPFATIANMVPQIENRLLLLANFSPQFESYLPKPGKSIFNPQKAFATLGQAIFKRKRPLPHLGKAFQNAKQPFCY
jgi:hypothetical protein